MIRYLLLSTLIVFGAAVIVAGWVNRDLIRVKIASVYAHVNAKPGGASAVEGATGAPLTGDAPWALSALPECLVQMSETHGSLAYVRAHLPPGAVPIVPPATLVYGDCSIAIVGEQAYVRRGDDHLRIPPRAHFYRAGDLLALVRESADGNELRVYERAAR